MLKRTITFLLAAAAAASGAALAQTASERVQNDPQRLLLEQIDRLQKDGGPNAEGLIEPLRALALLYEEAGDHVQAVVALQEARQVLRANRGLFSATVDEAMLLRQQIRSEKALGNGERVWDLQHDLLTIARQHFDDMRMLPIFRELIDDRTEILDEFRTTGFRDLPPGIYVPCESGAAGMRDGRVVVTDARNCPFGSWRLVVERLRGDILGHYAEAIEVIIRNGDYASRELRDLEKQALRIVPMERLVSCSGTFNQLLRAELVGGCLDPIGGAGVGGWASLMRLLYYEMRSGAPAGARASAYAELGDWYLRIEHLSSVPMYSAADDLALRLYQQAVAELGQGDAARESMAQIFSPELPVMLPTYAPNPLASTASSRFVDISFAITKYGKAEQIEIVGGAKSATRAEQTELTRLIKFGSFRPRAVDGALADSAPVVVRYYLPETPASSTVSPR